MEREVMWAPWERPGLEHLRLVTSDGDVVANGLVIGLEAGRPFRIDYEIRWTGGGGCEKYRWLPRTRSGRLEQTAATSTCVSAQTVMAVRKGSR